MSTDHEDLDPMCEQEIAALAALDRQGRAAGAALMTAAATTDAPPAPGRVDDGDVPADDFDLVRLSDRGPAHGGRRGRTWLLVAAVLVLLAAVAGSALVLGPKTPPPMSSDRPAYLVPGWLPGGFEPYVAATSASLEQVPDAVPPGDGRVVVYGLASAPDPWAEATVTVARLDTPWDQTVGTGEPVTVAGRAGEVGTIGDVEWVAWDGGDAAHYVVGQGVGREQVLQAAESAGPEPSLDPATLPPGFEVIAQGPASAMLGFPATANVVGPDALLLTYLPAGATDDTRLVGLIERPGDAADVDLARLWSDETRPAEVRGQHAVVGTHQDPGQLQQRFVQWWDPSGLLVTVAGTGVSEDELLHVVAELAPADDSEIEQLLANYGIENQLPVRTGDEDGALADMVWLEVASGDVAGGRWTVSAGSTGETMGLELSLGSDSVSTSWEASAGMDDLVVGPARAGDASEQVVAVAAGEQVAEITVEGAGLASPRPMELHPVSVETGTFHAFVAVLPVTGAGDYTFVYRDADGHELGQVERSADAVNGSAGSSDVPASPAT